MSRFAFFRRKANKQTPNSQYLMRGRYDRPDFERYTNPYDFVKQDPHVYGFIKGVVDAVSNLKVKQINSNGDKVTRSNEVMRFLEDQEFPELLGECIQSLIVTGNCFILSYGNIDALPNSFEYIPFDDVVLNDDLVNPKMTITIAQGQQFDFFYDYKTKRWTCGPFMEIIHARNIRVDNRFLGLSPLQAASAKLTIKTKGDDATATDLTAGVSSKLIISSEEEPSEQADRGYRRDVRNMYSGSDNTGSLMRVSGKGVKVHPLKNNNKDFEYIQIQQEAKEAFFQAMNMPIPNINENATTFNNFFVGQITYYTDVVFPMVNKILRRINHVFKQKPFVKNYYDILIDEDSYGPTLKTSLFEATRIIMMSGSVTENEARTMVGLPKLKFGGEVLFSLIKDPTPIGATSEEEYDKIADKLRGMRDNGNNIEHLKN